MASSILSPMETARETNAAKGTLQYRAEIDFLRAVAILPVVVFHLQSSLVRGGYLGVDVFFVLSGYLISALLLRDLDIGSFGIRHFYARRIRRLVPVILSVVTVTLLVATVCLSDSQRVYIGNQSVAALASVSNFYVWQNTGDYWGPTAETTVLLHTWSLSVEEQFYLFFPIMLALVHRARSDWVTAFFVVVVIASSLMYWVLMAASPSATFYLLPTRAWELACGGLLASLERSESTIANLQRPKLSQIRFLNSGMGCIVGLSLILLAYGLPSDSRGNELNTTVAVFGTMLFLATPKGASCFRYVSLPPLVYIGRISYSWYMWHWPIIVFNELTGVYASRWSTGIAGFVAAVLSYHLIEQTTRQRKGIIGWIAVAFVAVLGFAIFSSISRPIPSTDPALYETSRWYGSYYNAYSAGETNDWYQRIVSDVSVPKRPVVGNEFETEGIRFGAGEKPEVVLLGDSHATMWAHLVHQLVLQRGRSLSIWAVNGMDPFFTDIRGAVDGDSIKSRYDIARRNKLEQWHPKLTILSVRWSMRDRVRAKEFVQFVASCSDDVLLIGTTPELRIGDENVRDYLIQNGVVPDENRRHYLPRVLSESVLDASQFAQELANSIANVHYISVSERYEQESGTLVLVGRHCVYLDDDHLTDFGASLAKPAFEKALEDMIESDQKAK